MKALDNIIGFIFISALVIGAFRWIFGGEQEGYIKYDDCRREIQIEQGSLQTYYKKFTCTFDKTENGIVRSGTCVHVDSPLFSTSCETAYIYHVKQDPKYCKDPEYSYLAYDGKCYSQCKSPYLYRGWGTKDNTCYDTPQGFGN